MFLVFFKISLIFRLPISKKWYAQTWINVRLKSSFLPSPWTILYARSKYWKSDSPENSWSTALIIDLLWSTVTSVGPQLGFRKIFCSISFSLISGCLIENALCSDVICSRIAIGGEPTEGSLTVSAWNRILFFPPFSFLNQCNRETNKLLASKSKASYCETNW